MRGIPTADKPTADALRAKVDLAYGYPRCDRLAGTLVTSAKGLTCPCTVATAPDPRCQFATRAQALPVQTATAWAYPVDESKATTLGALTAGERAQITDVTEKPIPPLSAAAAADGKVA